MAKKVPKSEGGHAARERKLAKAIARARSEVEKRQRQLAQATSALAALEGRETSAGGSPRASSMASGSAKKTGRGAAGTGPVAEEGPTHAAKVMPSHTTSPAGAVASGAGRSTPRKARRTKTARGPSAGRRGPDTAGPTP